MQIKFDKILGCLRELDEGTGGGGTSGDTIITGTVATYAELPLASGYTGKYYIVDAATGTWILGTKKNAGIYKSNGTTWIYIDSVPETTSLSDGTTVITGTNIILQGTNGVTTTTDTANNKIVISAPSALSSLSGTNTGDITLAGSDYLSISEQQITANLINIDNMSATGIPSSSTYLRGDNTWSTISNEGVVDLNIDGGTPNSIYITAQIIDGGMP